VAELPGDRAVVSMRLKILHRKVDRASLSGGEREILGGGPEYSSRGKRRQRRENVVASIPLRGRFPR
jgi:hypothetical protein